MPFCTSCGNQVNDQTRFCPNCGSSVGGGGTTPPPNQPVQFTPPAVMEPLEYTIQGENLQVIRIKLKPGQELYAEAGKMLYKTTNVVWETRMSGKSIGEKIWGAIRRTLVGESLFLTYFYTNSPGEVGFAGNYPGKIQALQLEAGRSWMVQRDAFLVAQSSVNLTIALVKKLGAGFFGGEGFILEQLTGPGVVFIHAGGDHVEFNLAAGETLQVDTGCVVGFEESVNYDIQFVGSIKTAIFGGEGIFLTTLTGPGKVIVQSMTLQKMRRELAPTQRGGDERGPLNALGGIFSSED